MDADRANREALFRLGLQAHRAGRPDEALERFREAVNLGNAEPRHLSYLGLLTATRLRKASEGFDLCQRAALLAPDDPQMKINLAHAHVASGRRMRAAGILRSALREQPNNRAVLAELNRLFPRDESPLPFLKRNHFLNRILGGRRSRKKS